MHESPAPSASSCGHPPFPAPAAHDDYTDEDGHVRRPRRDTAGRPLANGLLVLAGVAAAAAAVLYPSERLHAAVASSRYQAVAFDYLALFDPNSLVPVAEDLFPGRGQELTGLWRMRQFEYSWLRSMTGRYIDFLAVAEDALVYAATALRLDLTAERRHRLLGAYLHLKPWPETRQVLEALRTAGVRVIALSNFDPMTLRANATSAGLSGLFGALVSTDERRTYKPDPRAYGLGVEHLRLAKEDILFVASAGWDAAGAKAFGYPTAWVNRLDQPAEELGIRPDHVVRDLHGLVPLVLDRRETARH